VLVDRRRDRGRYVVGRHGREKEGALQTTKLQTHEMEEEEDGAIQA
jgi:hypothetical protein